MWAPVGGAESPKGDGWHAGPAGGAFLPRKVAKEFLRDKIVIAFGVAEFYKRYSFVRLPGVGLLFCEEK